MRIKGAIFDLDGTLLDSMYIWDTIGEDYLKSRGIIPQRDVREILRPMSLLQAADYFRTHYGLADSVQEIMNGVNHMIEHLYGEVVELKPGVLDFLKRLHQDNVKICVATATERFLAEVALSRKGILSYVEAIFTCTEVGVGKDQPDIYLRAWEFLGTKQPETYVFEDALYAIETAKKATFPIIAVYDSSAYREQEEIKRLADVYITSFEEMRDRYDEESINHCRV